MSKSRDNNRRRRGLIVAFAATATFGSAAVATADIVDDVGVLVESRWALCTPASGCEPAVPLGVPSVADSDGDGVADLSGSLVPDLTRDDGIGFSFEINHLAAPNTALVWAEVTTPDDAVRIDFSSTEAVPANARLDLIAHKSGTTLETLAVETTATPGSAPWAVTIAQASQVARFSGIGEHFAGELDILPSDRGLDWQGDRIPHLQLMEDGVVRLDARAVGHTLSLRTAKASPYVTFSSVPATGSLTVSAPTDQSFNRAVTYRGVKVRVKGTATIGMLTLRATNISDLTIKDNLVTLLFPGTYSSLSATLADATVRYRVCDRRGVVCQREQVAKGLNADTFARGWRVESETVGRTRCNNWRERVKKTWHTRVHYSPAWQGRTANSFSVGSSTRGADRVILTPKGESRFGSAAVRDLVSDVEGAQKTTRTCER